MEEEAPLQEVVYKPTTQKRSSEGLKPESSKGSLFPYFAAAVANLVIFAVGIVFGWTSPVLPKLNGKIEPENNPLGYPVTPIEESWIAGFLTLGAVFGPLIGGSLADRIGRKKTIIVIACPIVVSLLVTAYARTVFLYYVMRFVAGVSCGSSFTVLPMYLGEIAEDHNRGTIGCFLGIFVTSGLLFAFGLGPYVTIKNFCLVSTIPLIIFFAVFTTYIPESPQFLAMNNDQKALEDSLSKFRKYSIGEARKEAETMIKIAHQEKENKQGIGDLIKSRGLRKGLILSVGLITLQQFAGINAVLCYMQMIFDAAGGGLAPEIATIIVGAVQVAASIVTSSIVDKLGRRILLLVSLAGSGVSLLGLGGYFYLKTHGFNVDSIFWLPVLSLMVYIVTFSIGIGPLPWAIMAELFPANHRSTASTITSFICFLAGFFIIVCFPFLNLVLGMAHCFWFFALVCVGGIVFVHFVLPETKGRSLQQIQRLLEGFKD